MSLLDDMNAAPATKTGQPTAQKSGLLSDMNAADPGQAAADNLRQEIEKPSQSFFEKAAGLFKQGHQAVLDTQIGGLKGAGSTVAGIASLGEKGLEAATKPLAHALGGKTLGEATGGTTTSEDLKKTGVLEPHGLAQKVGFGAEQTAELFTPVGAEGKAASLAEKATANAPKIAQTAAKVGAKALAGAAEFGGKTALQTEGDAEKTKEAALLGGATAPVAEAAAPVAKYLTEKLPPRIVNSLLKPLSKEFEFGRNPGKGVLEEGIKANTAQSLLENIAAKKQEVGGQIDSILSKPENAKKAIDIPPLLKPIDEAMAKAVKDGEQGLYTRLQSLKDGLTREFTAVDGNLIATGEKPTQLSPLDARKLKTEIGDATRWTGQAFDNDVNQVRVKVYRALNDAIDETVGGVKDLNARYANMLSAEKSLERTMSIKERQALMGLKSVGIGAALGVEEKLRGKSDPEALMTGLIGAFSEKALESTAAKTNIANALHKLSPEESVILEQAIPLLRNLFLGSKNVPKGEQGAADNADNG